jgi:hypothetical protein
MAPELLRLCQPLVRRSLSQPKLFPLPLAELRITNPGVSLARLRSRHEAIADRKSSALRSNCRFCSRGFIEGDIKSPGGLFVVRVLPQDLS